MAELTEVAELTEAAELTRSTEGHEVLVRYFASAAEAAGRDEELLPAVATVGQLRALLVRQYGDAMARVLASGSFLVDGVVRRDEYWAVGSRVDVLPPFAGG